MVTERYSKHGCENCERFDADGVYFDLGESLDGDAVFYLAFPVTNGDPSKKIFGFVAVGTDVLETHEALYQYALEELTVELNNLDIGGGVLKHDQGQLVFQRVSHSFGLQIPRQVVDAFIEHLCEKIPQRRRRNFG